MLKSTARTIKMVAATAILLGAAPLHAADILSAEQIGFQLSKTRGLSVETRVSVDLPAVQFELNSFNLTADARAQLDELAKVLNADRFKSRRFEIAGHTDASGGEAYNQSLSEQRARRVVSYLTNQHGVARSRMRAIGFGESRPADAANPFDPINRRAEVVLLRN